MRLTRMATRPTSEKRSLAEHGQHRGEVEESRPRVVAKFIGSWWTNKWQIAIVAADSQTQGFVHVCGLRQHQRKANPTRADNP
jgi:hypothetical protein